MADSRDEAPDRPQFSTRQLLEVVMLCCIALGAGVARNAHVSLAIIAAGMLLWQITGRQWRQKMRLTMGVLAVSGLAGLAAAVRMEDWTSAGTVLFLGAVIAVLITSLRNFRQDLHPLKAVVGLLASWLLLTWLLSPPTY